jgi:HK97 family phage major capsid protein
MTSRNRGDDAVKALVDDFFKGEIERGEKAMADFFAKLDRADDSNVPDTVRPYGSAGRARPAWERAYERQPWSEEERRWRTPAHDMEAVEFIRACASNDQAMLREIADRPHNRAYHNEWARADLAEGTIGSPGTGHGLVPVGFASAVEIILTASARMRNVVNVVRGNEFATKIPTQTAKTIAAVHAEAADMRSGVTDPTYGSVTPQPKKLGAIVKFSRELLDDSPLALMNLVTRDVGEAIGTLEDASVLTGSTFSDSLFVDVTTHGTFTWTDGTETLTTILQKYYSVTQVLRPRATWIFNEASAERIAGLTGTGERQQFTEFNPAPLAIDNGPGQVGTLIGRPAMVFANSLVTNQAIFGDLSGYTILLREPIRVETSLHSDFQTDQVALKVARRVDGVLTQGARMIRFP